MDMQLLVAMSGLSVGDDIKELYINGILRLRVNYWSQSTFTFLKYLPCISIHGVALDGRQVSSLESPSLS